MERDILLKKPFVKVMPGPLFTTKLTSTEMRRVKRDCPAYECVSQEQFIREYDPAGHKINSDKHYPDRIKYNEETKEYYKEYMFRACFPFQRIITTQQLIHLCGNDIHIELSEEHTSEAELDLILKLKKGWLLKDMEIAFYELAKSVKKTGDGATVMFLKDGKVYWKSLGYDKGDILYPHYDSISGELMLFARSYKDYDAEGKCNNTYVEVWDNVNLTRYKRAEKGIKAGVNKLLNVFGIDGFEIETPPTPHGFDEIPVVYVRDDDGACWSGSQDSIDKYELAISHLCQNNMAYAFPIMVLKGSEVEIKADIYGAVKAIDAGTDGEAKYLEPAGNVDSFKLQTDILLKNIFNGSFAVLPPEIKSGDFPGVTIKLIYSPSLDKAIDDSKFYQLAIGKMTRLFKFGYGIELSCATQMMNLQTYTWIEPYVHQNQTELVNNLVQLVNSDLLSHNTGSTLTGYGENNEYEKIIKEKKEQEKADLLFELNANGNTGANSETTPSEED